MENLKKPPMKGISANLSAEKYQGVQTVDFKTIPDGFRVVTVGSGSPVMSLRRTAPATLVQYKDKYFLVDCGYGTCLTLFELGLEMEDITNLLITHQHEDHNADFAHFLVAGWYNAMNPRPSLNLVAPYAKLIYEKTYEIYEEDIAGRQAMGTLSMDGIRDKVAIYNLTEDIFSVELDGVKVEAMKVIHGNMRSYAYKFTADGRCVVVSGDTAYCEGLTEFCTGADVLVMEAATMTGYFANFTPAMLANKMSGTHILEPELAKLLAEAKPGKVVLTHIINKFIDLDATSQVFRKAGYQGEIYGAYDGLAVEA